MAGVADWLNKIGCSQFIEAFEKNGVEFETLRELTNADLKDLGVYRLADRKHLLKEIEILAKQKAHSSIERRVLSILFCDLVGSTPLSQQLDIEEFRTAMRSYEDAAVQTIAKYGGYVAGYVGDGIVAYFGWPRADEGQATQAVRAALEAVAVVQHIKLDGGVVLSCRVSVASGQVAIGGEEHNESAMGVTPNLAARLQTLAGPNQIVIDKVTRRLIGARFELRPQQSARLKGFEHPVDVWEVIEEHKYLGQFEARHGGSACFLGRDKEILALLEIWQSVKCGIGQVVTVAGEAGIGKSRLVKEFEAEIKSSDVTVLRYQCSPYHVSSAFHPVIQHLEKAASFDVHGEPPSSKLEKIGLLFQDTISDNPRMVEILAALLSLSHADTEGNTKLAPAQRRELIIKLLVDHVIHLSCLRSILLIVEDTHWIDPSSVEMLNALINQTRRRAVMIVATHRPGHDLTLPVDPLQLTLERLSDKDIEAIARSVSQSSALSDLDIRRIASRVDGIPLFAEEFTSAAVDHQLGGEQRFDLPETIQASVMSRLDMLGDAKFVAQVASILGRTFRRSQLAVLTNNSPKILGEAITRLVASGLLLEGKQVGEIYQFKHALVRDVAYGSLSRKTRSELHKRLAYEILSDVIAEREPEVVAYHLTEAGLFPEAINHWKIAGYRASKASAHMESIAHFSRGLELIAKLPDESSRAGLEFSFQVGLMGPLIASKGYTSEELKDAISRALTLSQMIDRTPEVYAVLYSRWAFLLTGGSIAESYKVAQEFSELAVRQNDEDALLARYRMLGASRMCLGELNAAASALNQGISLYVPEKHAKLITTYGVDIRVALRCFQGEVLWLLGHVENARKSVAQALEEAKGIGHLHSIAMALFFCGLVSFLCRDKKAVHDRMLELTQLAAVQSIGAWPTLGRSMLGWSQLASEDMDKGFRMMLEGVAAAGNHGVSLFMPFIQCRMAEVLLCQGKLEEAGSLISEIEMLLHRTGERNYEAELLRLKAELCWKKSCFELADLQFRVAAEVAGRQSAKSIELRIATSFAKFLIERGEAARGLEILTQVYNWFGEDKESHDMTSAFSTLTALHAEVLAQVDG